MDGVWKGKLGSEVVIKRQHNTIRIVAIVTDMRGQPVYFLQGFSEELLSCLLKCPVKLEIQTADTLDMTFKMM